MVQPDEVKRQLVKIGAAKLVWGRPELRELPRILFEREELSHIVYGRYEGGYALLCATDQRVVLIDKKPFFLTLEDTRYEMISDVQFNHRLLDASLWLGTVHKRFIFRAYNHSKLRNMTSYIQQQVMTARQQPQQQMVQVTPATTNGLLPPNPVETLLETPARPPLNPYKTPLMIRHRVSRFY